jgi:hypothetical protein
VSEAAEPRQAGPWSPVAVVSMVLVGVFAFCALVVLLAYAPDLKSGHDGRSHALSTSAVGYGALVEALKLSGEPVLISRGQLSPDGKGLLIFTNDFPTTIGKPLSTRLGGRTVLIVLPKWNATPDPDHRGWVRRVAIVDPRIIPKDDDMAEAKLVRRAGVSRPILHGVAAPFGPGMVLREGPVDSFQTMTTTDWTPILTDERGGVVLAQEPGRRIFRLSDPDLLDTQGLKALDTLASGLAILKTLKGGDGPFIFDVTLNGFARQRGVLRLLFDPPFLGVTLSLAVAAALAGFQAFCRFGPTRRAGRAIALGKEAMVDNAAALIRLARREPRMGPRYAALTRGLAAQAVGAPRDLSDDDLTVLLDRLGVQRGTVDSLGALDIQSRGVRDRDGLTAVALKLFRWRLEMTRERQ